MAPLAPKFKMFYNTMLGTVTKVDPVLRNVQGIHEKPDSIVISFHIEVSST